MSTSVNRIESWTDLAALLSECTSGDWMFRGQSSGRHDLKPKAGRVGNYRGAPRKRPYKVEDERKALELFKRQARPYLTHTPTTDMEWLAIAQHHGMSTRLLDWTQSILIAAYFATAEAGADGDAIIYGIKGMRRLDQDEEHDPFLVRSPGMYEPPHITARIPAQAGLFSVHPDPTAAFVTPDINSWAITSKACSKIKKTLDACAINESSLFPDVDGLARHIAWRYKWSRL